MAAFLFVWGVKNSGEASKRAQNDFLYDYQLMGGTFIDLKTNRSLFCYCFTRGGDKDYRIFEAGACFPLQNSNQGLNEHKFFWSSGNQTRH